MKKIILYLALSFSFIRAQDDFIVIGIGESCGVSGALEIFNLKKASYPFEWCISNFEPLYNSLKNNFYDYTNPAYFTNYIDNKSLVNKYGIVFAHDFPVLHLGVYPNGQENYILDPNWHNAIPTIQAKYQRRIDRFNAACTSGKKVYFVRFLGIEDKMATRLSDLLSSLYPNLDFTIICVRLKSPPFGTWNIKRVKNYYLDTTSPEGDIGEWRRIFLDAGIISHNKSWDKETALKIYTDNLCGNCSYCQNLKERML